MATTSISAVDRAFLALDSAEVSAHVVGLTVFSRRTTRLPTT